MGPAQPPAKRPRFCMEPNLEVEVGGEVFMVQALLIMQRSPVFRRMLETDMREAQEAHISLPGKSKEEFRILVPMFLHVDAEIQVTSSNARPLLHWAREYDIEYLKLALDRFLVADARVTMQELKLAVEFKLRERTQQCVKEIATDIHQHMPHLKEFADDPEVMVHVWPAIFQAAGAPCPRLTEKPSPRDLWPLISAAVGSSVLAALNKLAGKKVKIPVKYGILLGCSIRKVLKDGEVEIAMADGISKRRAKWGEWSFGH